MYKGDKVALRLRITGSYKERLFVSAAGPGAVPGKIDATEMLMFLIQNGKVKEIWEDYDELRMRYEMGGAWRTNGELAAASSKATPKRQ